jgi:hypothetical protein
MTHIVATPRGGNCDARHTAAIQLKSADAGNMCGVSHQDRREFETIAGSGRALGKASMKMKQNADAHR